MFQESELSGIFFNHQKFGKDLFGEHIFVKGPYQDSIFFLRGPMQVRTIDTKTLEFVQISFLHQRS